MGNVIGIVIILIGGYLILVGVRGTQGAVFSGFTGAVTPQQTSGSSTTGKGGTGLRAYMAHSGVRYAG